MYLAYFLDFFPALLNNRVIKYQGLDTPNKAFVPPYQAQISFGKQVQYRPPTDILSTQKIVPGILASISNCILSKLPGQVAVDVPAFVKQHHQ